MTTYIEIPSQEIEIDAAEIIGCTTGYVRHLCRQGKIRGAKLGERAWAVSGADARSYASTPCDTGRPRSLAERQEKA